ncbi:GIY-YIG nuclease family protein [uncultured Weissella sp.]|uniref:GIY-YIG nuclease family protein n=1 Tax=uncultured Weissella sp. TaxID=253243 RepID=UPI002588680A|nr:GIY-YIG nuclease family protein [uncultured Weissella sp.]
MAINFDDIFNDMDFDELTKVDKPKKNVNESPEVAKFQEIIDFVNDNKREPKKTSEWSHERALWARLQGFRDNDDRAALVKKYDLNGILERPSCWTNNDLTDNQKVEDLDTILNESNSLDDFNNLLDVSRYKKTINAADKIGRRKHAKNFDQYKKLFEEVHADIASGRRNILPFKQYDIEENRFYIQNGVMLYIISISRDKFIGDNGKLNARMHVIYENGTENKDLLLQSLASSLYSKERNGRMITEVIDGNSIAEDFGANFTTGYIYVLKSLSKDPEISKISNLYKIGFTNNKIEQRLENAKNEITYLNAPVQLVLSAEIKNINAQLLERTLHHVFKDKQVIFQDDKFKKATEWFIISLDDIEVKINKIISDLQK